MRKHFLNIQTLESLSIRVVIPDVGQLTILFALQVYTCKNSSWQAYEKIKPIHFFIERSDSWNTCVCCIWYNLIFILYITFDSKLFSPLNLSTELNLKGARKEHFQLRTGISYCVLSHNMNSLQLYCAWSISQMSWIQDILSFGVMLIILRNLQILWWTVESHHTAFILCVPLGPSIIKKKRINTK